MTELASRTIIAPGIADLTFRMVTPPALAFQAGQFVSIAVEGTSAESTSPSRRSYSIASQSDASDHLRFIIRVIPTGAASDLLMSLTIGAPLRMTGPHGFFVLDPAHAGDVVFGATGTGVAAVMPMLGELSRRQDAGRRYLFWGLRHEADLFAHDEIARLCEKSETDLRIHLSAPDAAWTGARGRISAAILDLLPQLREPTFYLVGNGAMITELKRDLVGKGINRKKQIRTEAFFD